MRVKNGVNLKKQERKLPDYPGMALGLRSYANVLTQISPVMLWTFTTGITLNTNIMETQFPDYCEMF